jgi:hypothetical protein
MRAFLSPDCAMFFSLILFKEEYAVSVALKNAETIMSKPKTIIEVRSLSFMRRNHSYLHRDFLSRE